MDGPVLITGAAGFAGSHMLDLLEPAGRDITAWRRPGEPLPSPPTGATCRWVEVDVLDAGLVRRAMLEARPSLVCHFAGAAHAGASWSRSARTLQVNVMGTHHVLEAAAALDPAPRVLVTGSALVYREQDRALREDDAVGPASPYALSKLAQEMAGAHAFERGLPVLLTRPFNHLGPRQSPQFFASSVARQVARVERGLAPPVVEVGNLDASRDLSDVRDTVRAYLAILERGTPGRLYNVCAGRAFRIGDILDGLLSRSRVRIEVRQDPGRYRRHDAPLVLGDLSRLSGELGWAPEIPMERTLTDLLDYWRQAALTPDAAAPGDAPSS